MVLKAGAEFWWVSPGDCGAASRLLCFIWSLHVLYIVRTAMELSYGLSVAEVHTGLDLPRLQRLAQTAVHLEDKAVLIDRERYERLSLLTFHLDQMSVRRRPFEHRLHSTTCSAPRSIAPAFVGVGLRWAWQRLVTASRRTNDDTPDEEYREFSQAHCEAWNSGLTKRWQHYRKHAKAEPTSRLARSPPPSPPPPHFVAPSAAIQCFREPLWQIGLDRGEDDDLRIHDSPNSVLQALYWVAEFMLRPASEWRCSTAGLPLGYEITNARIGCESNVKIDLRSCQLGLQLGLQPRALLTILVVVPVLVGAFFNMLRWTCLLIQSGQVGWGWCLFVAYGMYQLANGWLLCMVVSLRPPLPTTSYTWSTLSIDHAGKAWDIMLIVTVLVYRLTIRIRRQLEENIVVTAKPSLSFKSLCCGTKTTEATPSTDPTPSKRKRIR